VREYLGVNVTNTHGADPSQPEGEGGPLSPVDFTAMMYDEQRRGCSAPAGGGWGSMKRTWSQTSLIDSSGRVRSTTRRSGGAGSSSTAQTSALPGGGLVVRQQLSLRLVTSSLVQ